MVTSVKILNTNNQQDFKTDLEQLLSEGYKLESSSIGIIQSEKYDFQDIYQALLIKNSRDCLNNPVFKIGQKVKILKPSLSAGDTGEIIGYQKESFIDGKNNCHYVVDYWDTDCKMQMKFSFEKELLVAIDEPK